MSSIFPLLGEIRLVIILSELTFKVNSLRQKLKEISSLYADIHELVQRGFAYNANNNQMPNDD